MPSGVIPSGIEPFVVVRTAAGPATLVRRAWTFYVVKQDVPAAFALSLPASPVRGDIVSVTDGAGSASAGNITVSGNGKLIGGAASATISTDYGALVLEYDGVAWFALSGGAGGGGGVSWVLYQPAPGDASIAPDPTDAWAKIRANRSAGAPVALDVQLGAAASLTDGQRVEVTDSTRCATTAAITITAGAGTTIMGAASYTFTADGQSGSFDYDAANTNWIMV